MKITLSKSQWEFIGQKAGWIKTAYDTRWFTWDDNNGGKWDVLYRDIEPSEMYENGKALSDRAIMEKMIIGIQNKASDETLRGHMIKFWIDKLNVSPADFFEEVQQANNSFKDEQRIEQRDIDAGLV